MKTKKTEEELIEIKNIIHKSIVGLPTNQAKAVLNRLLSEIDENSVVEVICDKQS